DVYCPQGPERVAPATLPHALKQQFAVERVLPEQQRFQCLDHELGVSAGGTAGGAEEGVADHALVALDGDEAEVAAPGDAGRVAPVLRGRDVVPGEQSRVDIGDFHDRVSFQCRRVAAGRTAATVHAARWRVKRPGER